MKVRFLALVILNAVKDPVDFTGFFLPAGRQALTLRMTPVKNYIFHNFHKRCLEGVLKFTKFIESVARVLPAAILAFWLRLRRVSQKVLNVALRLRLRAFCSSSLSRSKIQNFAFVRTRATGSIIVAVVLAILPAFAEGYDLKSQVTEFKLASGMRWLLVRRAQAPVFSGVVMVRVGGADEVEGKTGLAHMFEHMAFKGSEKLGTRDFGKEKPILDEIEKIGERLTEENRKEKPDKEIAQELSAKLASLEREADKYREKNEIWQVMVRNGAADLNAYTSKDLTAYHASMPITKLELWARITADMVFEPVYREFYTERKVVAEERRSGVENNPDGAMGEKIVSAAYANGPYHWSTIGFEKDILGLTIKDAREFHEKYYRPSNMVGVLVGDINIAAAKKIILDAFGKYPARPAPQGPKNSGKEKGDVAEKFEFKAEPSLAVAFHKPTLPNPAEYTFDVINALLCDGRSSRLERALIYDKKVAQDVYCTVGYPGSRLDNLFLIWVDPLKPHKPSEALKVTLGELEKLKQAPISESELARVRKKVTSSLVFALDQNMKLALELAQFETIFGDWRLIADYPDRISAVTADDVRAAAQKYLDDANRVVVERLKK